MDLEMWLKLENDSGVIGADFIRKNPGVGLPYLIVICMATASGTIGNALVIAAVLSNKHLKTVGNVFIVNLALADFCVTGFVDPFSIIGILRGEVWFEDKAVLCEIVASVCLTSCFCSLLNIGSISFNRYIHICHNNLYQKIYTWRNSLIMCVCLWVLCFLLEMPNFFGWGDHLYDRKNLACVWDRTADFSYTMFFSTVGVGFPVVFISICYLKIFLHVRQSKRKVAALRRKGQLLVQTVSRENRESMRLARTLFIIFVVFAVCWTPYAIIVAADIDDTYPIEIHIFAVLVAHTNSSLNSVLYGLTNQHFRRSYYKILHIDGCLQIFRCKRIDVAKARETTAITKVAAPSSTMGASTNNTIPGTGNVDTAVFTTNTIESFKKASSNIGDLTTKQTRRQSSEKHIFTTLD